jgi:hypothetical protein
MLFLRLGAIILECSQEERLIKYREEKNYEKNYSLKNQGIKVMCI